MATDPVLPDSSYYAQFPYIRFVEGSDSAGLNVTDEEFLDEAAKVIFIVNKYDLPKNDTLLRCWREELIPHLNKDNLQLYRILLRGAASPEGPYLNNRRLGVNRAKALYDFFAKYMDTPVGEEMLFRQIEVEDYRLLCILMKRAGDPAYPLVQGLYDDYRHKHAYGDLKERLKQLQGGKLWRRLLRDYFPQLRAARMILLLRKMPAVEPVGVEVPPYAGLESIPLDIGPLLPLPRLRLPRRELLSVKTNLLFDVAYVPGYDRWCPIPNVALEYYPKAGHFTYGASIDFPWWVDYGSHKFFEIRNYQLETRYYLRSSDGKVGGAFSGLYLQAYAHGGLFEIGFNKDKGWRGHGFGAGVGAGYVTPLSRNGHWRLELGLQLGWLTCWYDPFKFENPVNPDYHDQLYYYKWTGKVKDFRKLQYRYNWLGPTRIGVTLSYDLLYRRSGKRWPGLRSYEAYRPERRRP